MRLRTAAVAASIGAVVALSASAAGGRYAVADAPRRAEIVEGRSMAGVAVNSEAAIAPAYDRVDSGVLAGWGRVRGGTCFEGSNCSWKVAGGGTVDVIVHVRNSRVQRIATNALGWRTARGVGRGSTIATLRRAYGRRIVRRTTCGLNGFGGTNTGFVLNSRHAHERRFTFFELGASRRRVSRIWVGRGRVVAAANC